MFERVPHSASNHIECVSIYILSMYAPLISCLSLSVSWFWFSCWPVDEEELAIHLFRYIEDLGKPVPGDAFRRNHRDSRRPLNSNWTKYKGKIWYKMRYIKNKYAPQT